jgi:hypothetical protein
MTIAGHTVVGEGSAILKLLSGEDQPLLVWGNALLVLDLALDIVDSVRRLDLKSDGLSSETALSARTLTQRHDTLTS